MKEEKIFSRTKGVAGSEMDGEIVMMSMETGKYYCLNPVASRIWQLLEEPITLSELVDKLLKEYEVERAVCLTEIEDILDKLDAEGLLEIKLNA